VLVTLERSATGGTKRHFSTFPDVPSANDLFPLPGRHSEWYPVTPTKSQTVGFVDWLSMHQSFIQPLPVLSDGAFVRFDADGRQRDTRLARLRIDGSYETGIFIRCDGHTVFFDGNISRYGRPDNVFGYTFRECLIKINMILNGLGLPHFSEGEKYVTNWKAEPRIEWTGAVITRIDITENFGVGSSTDAYAFLRWLQGQQVSRLKTGTCGDGETVDFGRGSTYVYSKAYLKAPEIRRHAVPNDVYLNQLADWCDEVGLVRFEATYKAKALRYLGCRFLGGFDMKRLELDFRERKEVLSRGSVEREDLSDLPKHILGTYRMWAAGDDIASKLPRRTFYRHRRALLPYGVDIAVKSNVKVFQPKTRVIKLGPVSAPDWYELPVILGERNGTNG